MKTLLAVIAMSVLAWSQWAAAQQMYRYVDRDGRIVYSDQPPPADARKVEQRNLRSNVIETSETPFATREAQRMNPVSLYVFDCGDVCDRARSMLNRRGVPHATYDTTKVDHADRLKKLTGGMEVPVLQVGARVLRGLDEAEWHAALDTAGYPRTPPPRAAITGRAEQIPPAGASAAQAAAPGAANATGAGDAPAADGSANAAPAAGAAAGTPSPAPRAAAPAAGSVTSPRVVPPTATSGERARQPAPR